MTLHNFICDSHQEDHDFVQCHTLEKYLVTISDDDDYDEHTQYEPTSYRAMKNLCDVITNEIGRRCYQPSFLYNKAKVN